MAPTIPTPAVVAVAAGVTGAAWSSGAIASLSIIGIPTALGLSGSSAGVWAGLYNHGIAIMPKVAVAVAASHLYAAYDANNRGVNWTGYAAAAVLAVSIAPYTILLMDPTNNKLLAAAAGSSTYRAREVADLASHWGVLNFGRSLFPLASALIGFVTFYQNVSQ